jgi:hypothetical protein
MQPLRAHQLAYEAEEFPAMNESTTGVDIVPTAVRGRHRADRCDEAEEMTVGPCPMDDHSIAQVERSVASISDSEVSKNNSVALFSQPLPGQISRIHFDFPGYTSMLGISITPNHPLRGAGSQDHEAWRLPFGILGGRTERRSMVDSLARGGWVGAVDHALRLAIRRPIRLAGALGSREAVSFEPFAKAHRRLL